MLRFKSTLLAITMLFISYGAFSNYTCFHTFGDVKLNKGGESLDFTKDDTFDNGELIVGPDSYVILVSKDEEILRLNDPGNYSLAKCHEMLEKSQAGFFAKYLSFIVKNLWKEKPKEELKTMAGVTRGPYDLEIYPYAGEVLYSDEISFHWKNVDGETLYLTLFDEGGNLISQHSVKRSRFTLHREEVEELKAGKYLWSINEDRFAPPKGITFSIASKMEIEQFKKEEMAIKEELVHDDQMNKLILAEFYRKKNALSQSVAALAESGFKFNEDYVLENLGTLSNHEEASASMNKKE